MAQRLKLSFASNLCDRCFGFACLVPANIRIIYIFCCQLLGRSEWCSMFYFCIYLRLAKRTGNQLDIESFCNKYIPYLCCI